MAQESVLTDMEKESFHIEKFIFHIIIQQQHTPEYLEEVKLTDVQEDFFKKRFSEVSEGTQYIFIDKAKSALYHSCKEIINNPETHFVEMSKTITMAFKQHHNKNTNDGVFITALVSVNKSRKLIFLLKLDHKIVYQYKRERSKAILNEIKDTFVEDKKAIQKAALIDISEYYIWDVLAKDRTAANTEGSIRDYFSKFLTVTERETPSKLTENAVKFANRWAITNISDLDPGQEPSTYKSRAIAYLQSASKFKTKDFIEAVINFDDENVDRRQALKKSFKKYLDESGMSGQSFIPNKNSLTKTRKKNVRMTAEGIKIEWEGDPGESNLTIPTRQDADGLYHILIKTTRIDNLDRAK